MMGDAGRMRGTALRIAGPPAGVVDVWRARLDMPDFPHDALAATLDDDERMRAARMRDGLAWAAARSVRRAILAAYLEAPPKTLRFAAGEFGKPCLADVPELRFSCARTGGLAVLAAASDREVGIDVERENERTDIAAVAWEFLPPEDAEALENTPPERRRSAFFDAWARHEARLKLEGRGLGEAAAPHTPPGPAAVVRAIAIAPGFACAVAARNLDWTVRVRTWLPARATSRA